MKTLLTVVVALCFIFLSISAQAKTRLESTVKIGNLLWLNEPDVMMYSDADDFCSKLNQEDGSWRLPTIKELRSLFKNKEGLSKMKFDRYLPYLWSSEYSENENMRHEVNLLNMKDGRVFHQHDSRGYGLATCVKPVKK